MNEAEISTQLKIKGEKITLLASIHRFKNLAFNNMQKEC